MLSGAAFGKDIKSFHQLMGPTEVGALMLAIDIERFMPVAHFRNLMKGYVEAIRGSRKAKGAVRIYLPGEIESEKEMTSGERGIELRPASVELLNQLLEKLESPMRL
jgi:L-2-hydroxycarboxylate dehydrogenase (NAD+)